MTYAIPAHNLSAPRPAPISFEAARAEAARVHVETVADADSAAQTASRGGVANASTQAGEAA
jgi:hypothetical protein